MIGRTGQSVGSASFAVHPGLRNVAAGWVDREMVTVRQMAKDGATFEEIGAACGRTAGWARGFVRRNGIVRNKDRQNIHIMASAQAIGFHERVGHGQWHDDAARFRLDGMKIREIADRLGVLPSTVGNFLSKHDIRKPLQSGASE